MNFTEITRENLVKKPSDAPAFDNAKIGGGLDDGRVWVAVEFSPADKAGAPVTLQGSPTQWLELCHALYGIAARLLELQNAEHRRRELGLDLLPSAGNV